MAHVEACRIGFQCPQCGCGIGISIDATRMSNVVEDIREAAEKVPSEITIEFYRQRAISIDSENEGDRKVKQI